MPWCPKCKLEFQNDITVCTDCGTTLVNQLEDDAIFVPLAEINEEEKAKKLIDFLQYEGIQDVTCEYLEESDYWMVQVKEDSYGRASKLYRAFSNTEKEKANAEKSLTDEEVETKTSKIYVKKEDQYEDLKSTTYSFLLISIIGLIYLILNVLGIVKHVTSPFTLIVMGMMFIAFFIIGILSGIKARNTKDEIGLEEEETKEINQWLKENINEEVLQEVQDDEMSSEVNYYHKTERIKKLLLAKFDIHDEAYLEHLIEDFYNTEIDHI